MQRADLGPHMHAQLRIEVGERLIHQEGLRLAHDGATERHTLALPAGELARSTIQQMRDIEDAGRVGHPPFDLGGRVPRIFRPKPMFFATVRCG